jgi:hypothetical protein
LPNLVQIKQLFGDLLLKKLGLKLKELILIQKEAGIKKESGV